MGVSLFAVACAQSWRGLSPSARIVPGRSIDASSLIGYRTLTPTDFWAERPPAKSAKHADHLGALLCASIAGNADLAIQFQSRDAAAVHWFVFRDPDYRAKMDRSCSWWNPGQGLAPTDYVLEHEQIHFALMEIFARRINRQIRNLRMRVASREAAPSVARANLTTLLEAAKKGYLAESRHFDEQTSHPPDPGSQARWRHQVETRLREVER